MATPLDIEILMHYWCSAQNAGDFREAPATVEAIARFVEIGLLVDDGENHEGPRRYRPTEGIQVYLNALCAVPFPEQRWVIPNAADTPRSQ